MIVRVLSAKVRAARVNQFNAGMRKQLALIRDQPGLVYVKLARRLDAEGGEEVVLFEEWRDPDSVYAWAGPDLSKARLVAGLADVAESLTVGHYESLDIDPDSAGDPPTSSQSGGATSRSGVSV